MKRTLCHLAAVVAAMVPASFASAGDAVGFELHALGVAEEEIDVVVVIASVTSQTPGLGLDTLQASFLVDDLGDPELFIGPITLHRDDDNSSIFIDAAGVLFREGFQTGIAGSYTVTGGDLGFEGASGSGVLVGIFGQGETGAFIRMSGTIAGAPPACPQDINGDGNVDAADLGALLGAWGPNPGNPADINGDGDVDAADLGALLGAWGPCVG